MLALLLVVGGVIAYRWNTNIAGQLVVLADLMEGTTASYTRYVPAPIEIAVGSGIVAYGVLAVTLGIRFFNIIDHSGVEETVPAEEPVPAQPSLAPTD